MERDDDAAARNQPEELFPEWTTHPHTPETVRPREATPTPASSRRPASVGGRWSRVVPSLPRAPAPGKAALAPEARRALVTLALLVALAGAAIWGETARRRSLATLPRDHAPPGEALSPDAALGEAARSRVRRRHELARLPVTVQVRDEVVVVSGRVPDARTREALLDCLRMTPGVRGVVDHTALDVGLDPGRQAP